MLESVSPGSRLESIHQSRGTVVRAIATVVLSTLLASCGGGGGGSGSTYSGGGPSGGGPSGDSQTPTITYSTTDIHFEAAKPYSPTPASQTITATVSGSASGTLYILIVENDPQLVTVPPSSIMVTGPTTGQATVVPADPSYVLAGSHQGSLTVKACLNDPTCATGQLAGSPQTITVHYDIGSTLDADTVNPRVIQSNLAGKLTLRGHGFAIGDTVAIGSTLIPTTSISYYSDSDIGLNYPPLAAGTYPISINSGNLSYSATLTVVDPTAFPSGFLSYPSITPTAIQSLDFDGQRNALFVVLGTGTQPVLLRYAFDGTAWSAPAMATIDGLQQVHLSPDGTKLLALLSTSQQASIAELDPITLSQTANTSLPSSLATRSPGGNPTGWFSLANDANAVVVLQSMMLAGNLAEGTNSYAFVFGTSSRVYSVLSVFGGGSTPLAPISSGDGNIVAFGSVYNASGGTVTGLPSMPLGGLGQSTNLNGDRFVVPDPYATYPGVYNQVAGAPMGYLPVTQGAVMNSAGTRVYDVEGTSVDPSPNLHIFDTSAAPTASPTAYPELTPALSLASDPGIGSSSVPLFLTISTDSGTVFVAGQNGIAVQPVPH